MTRDIDWSSLPDGIEGRVLIAGRDGASELARLSRDSSRAVPGRPGAALLAVSRRDVELALAWANERRIPVSVRGAGTGLAGGAMAFDGGLVISLEAMRRVLGIDPVNRTATVEPGVITAELDALAREHGLFFAPDPASARTSSIGGNIATNAGGLRCVAHGVTADAVASLEVVLADGRVLDTGALTRKNVVGYDLTRLFVGSEGTLGVVTRATVRLTPLPAGENVTFRAMFDDLAAAGRAVGAIVQSPERPEVLEMLDRFTVETIEAAHGLGLPTPGAAMLVGQTAGATARERAEAIARLCVGSGAVDASVMDDDGVIEARRLSNPSLTARGLRASCDVAVPVGALTEMFVRVEAIAASHGRRVSTVAHAGDGNLHCAIETFDESPAEYAAAEAVLDEITRLALELHGTISGEHGIGSLKVHEVPWQLDAVSLDVHHAIRRALDPNGILSPGRTV